MLESWRVGVNLGRCLGGPNFGQSAANQQLAALWPALRSRPVSARKAQCSQGADSWQTNELVANVRAPRTVCVRSARVHLPLTVCSLHCAHCARRPPSVPLLFFCASFCAHFCHTGIGPNGNERRQKRAHSNYHCRQLIVFMQRICKPARRRPFSSSCLLNNGPHSLPMTKAPLSLAARRPQSASARLGHKHTRQTNKAPPRSRWG